MHLFFQELIEVAEHECCQRLVAKWEIVPAKVGLDSSIRVVEHDGVHEG